MLRPRLFPHAILAALLAASAQSGCATGEPSGDIDGGTADAQSYGEDAAGGLDASGDACVPASDTEECNGLDDDCNGEIDEGFPGTQEVCTEGEGACERAGVTVCTSDGTDLRCTAIPRAPSDEVCGNNVDEDCDGVDNNGCPCNYLGDTDGVCAGGGTIGSSGECDDSPATYESDEVSCDALDNDCDGVDDEGCPCDYLDDTDGVCAGGGTLDTAGVCSIAPATYEADETTCDAHDNDCDGVANEGCACDYLGDTDGVCAGGGMLDAGGDCTIAPASYQANETTCDLADNDCDAVTDEGCPCNYLGDTDGVCAGGGTIDAGGSCSIAPAAYQATETTAHCDSVDNDCDGVADVGCPCNFLGSTNGVCAGGGLIDSSGLCTVAPAAYQGEETAAHCDGADNDCDNVVDEGCPCDFLGSTNGVCAGGGTLDSVGFCSIAPAGYQGNETAAHCDGADNDCDGGTDEGCPCDYLGSGLGVCDDGGTRDANGDCTIAPPGYQGNETSCDSSDNDCDGGTDEGCPCNYLGSTSGVCAGGGTRDSNGNCTIAPSDWQSVESTCDWTDNDCDGRDDEGCLPNDLCTEATALSIGEGQGTYTFDYATHAATDCASGREMWFRFTIAEERVVYFDTFDTDFDTVLSLRSDCAAAYTSCIDDQCSTLQSRLAAVVGPGTYYVAVHAFSTGTLTGTVTLRWQMLLAAGGDDTPISASGTYSGSTTGGAAILKPPTSTAGCLINNDGYDPGDGPEDSFYFMHCPDVLPKSLSLDTCDAGTAYDSSLWLTRGGATTAACDDDSCDTPALASQLTGATVDVPGLWMIVVDGFGSASGNYTLTVSGL